METFSALLAICAGNSPHKGQWRGALMFSLICAWITACANNREAGDLRRHRAHYDVTVMNVVDRNWAKCCVGSLEDLKVNIATANYLNHISISHSICTGSCCTLFCRGHKFLWIHAVHLPAFFRVVSLPSGHSRAIVRLHRRQWSNFEGHG